MKRNPLWLVSLLVLLATACSSVIAADGDAQVDETDQQVARVAPTVDGGEYGLNEEVASRTFMWQTDWSKSTIDLADLAAGIRTMDPRDTIPPIDNPQYESVSNAALWLTNGDPGALVEVDGVARFFPLAIMTRHEIVNTDFGDTPVSVTYCPLCNTALAFDRRVEGRTLRLGVSGLLRLSDMVMWDRETGSLWQQITGEAIVGDFAGTKLAPVSTSIVSFAQFRDTFPDGESLSEDTGYGIEYGANPYVGYSSADGPSGAFFREELDDRFPALSRVVGVQANGIEKAYPFDAIAESGVINDLVGTEPVVLFWTDGAVDALDNGSIAASRAIGTGVARSPVVNGEQLTFSGANGVFVDEQTRSTWNGLGVAVEGPLAGEALGNVTHRNEFWFAWAAFFGEAGEVYLQ